MILKDYVLLFAANIPLMRGLKATPAIANCKVRLFTSLFTRRYVIESQIVAHFLIISAYRTFILWIDR